MNSILFSSLALAAASPGPADDAGLSARLDVAGAEALVPGTACALVVEVAPELRGQAQEADMPAPILQLDVPACVELSGERLTTYEELMRNEFLEAPFEHLLKGPTTRVELVLKSAPAEGETIGLVFTGYTKGGDGRPAFFRRRLELPLAPGAEAVRGDDRDSSWGDDDLLLQIGDPVVPFELPRPDGSLASLDPYLGAKNVIVTTFRAHW